MHKLRPLTELLYVFGRRHHKNDLVGRYHRKGLWTKLVVQGIFIHKIAREKLSIYHLELI